MVFRVLRKIVKGKQLLTKLYGRKIYFFIATTCTLLYCIYEYTYDFGLYKYCAKGSSLVVGRITTNVTDTAYKDMVHQFHWLRNGGYYKPAYSCFPGQKIAVIIPVRNRENHLRILLNNLHPILYHQRIEYSVYVLEQADQKGFNKGKLYNIGYVEAIKRNHTCFVFHDVDLIPENDRISYGCVKSPMHLSRAIDKFSYRLPYDTLIGGVSVWRRKEFEMVNGWSNLFINWGGEDDDMSYRIMANGLKLYRFKDSIARYKMIRHKQGIVNTKRYTLLEDSLFRWKVDGLSSLTYNDPNITKYGLFTKVSVML